MRMEGGILRQDSRALAHGEFDPELLPRAQDDESFQLFSIKCTLRENVNRIGEALLVP